MAKGPGRVLKGEKEMARVEQRMASIDGLQTDVKGSTMRFTSSSGAERRAAVGVSVPENNLISTCVQSFLPFFHLPYSPSSSLFFTQGFDVSRWLISESR